MVGEEEAATRGEPRVRVEEQQRRSTKGGQLPDGAPLAAGWARTSGHCLRDSACAQTLLWVGGRPWLLERLISGAPLAESGCSSDPDFKVL